MPKLIFMDRDFAGQVYELVIEKTTVGRATQNTLVLRHETVSSHHCELLFNGPEIIVRDLDSRNGTFVDGVRITGQRQVKSGQKIRFGEVEARLELDAVKAEDWDTQETAIHLHQKLVREARSPDKAPASPSAKLGSDSDIGDEHTILCPAPREAQRSPAVVTDVPPPKPSSKRLLIVGAILVALVIATVVWWLAKRS